MGKPQSTGNLVNALAQDSSNNIGIGGAANASFKLQVTGAGNFTGALRTASTFTSGDTIQLGLASTDGGFWTWGASNSFLVAATGKALNLNPNGTSGSTGLSIATTGAATFSSSVDATIFNSTSNAFRFSGSNALSLVTLDSQNVVKINAAGYWGVQLVGANDQGILINNTGTSTFSSSVGIGISPVVPSGTGKVLQISNTTIVQSVVGSQTLFGDNVYYNGSGWQYLTSNFASGMRIGALASGDFSFHCAASGSAGGSMPTWDTTDIKMIIKRNGNVGIGTNAPVAKFEVNGGSLNNNDSTFSFGISTGLATGRFGSYDTNSLSALSTYYDFTAVEISSGSSSGKVSGIAMVGGNATNNTNTLRFYTASAERLRITPEGYFDFYYNGTTNTGAIVLTANDMLIGGQTGKGLILCSNNLGQERLKITSNGSMKLYNADYGTAYAFSFKGVSGGIDAFAGLGTGANGNNIINFFNQSNTYVASIVINASTVTYGTGSDYRLKKDLKDFNGLEKVCAIKVYDFKFKEEGDRMEGVIAHELQEIVPYAVTGYKDELDKDGNAKIQNVDYSKLVPVLVKAIQELTQKVNALENK